MQLVFTIIERLCFVFECYFNINYILNVTVDTLVVDLQCFFFANYLPKTRVYYSSITTISKKLIENVGNSRRKMYVYNDKTGRKICQRYACTFFREMQLIFTRTMRSLTVGNRGRRRNFFYQNPNRTSKRHAQRTTRVR